MNEDGLPQPSLGVAGDSIRQAPMAWETPELTVRPAGSAETQFTNEGDTDGFSS
ncbi:hypothetical protein J2S76_000554 [Ancylobacter vacuolatus]|uniref:Uncharacterized protein n=1 Tax=Ancylobacter vacuolatus TaxID=223389 RepID=A0ABU0DCU6_9HYPH|nr:hypothetical protein [Ancylobacter vacuolatus]